MAGVNSSNVGLVYTNYLQEVSETLNHQAKGRQLCKKEKSWTGTHLEWRVHTGRTSAVGFVDDGGQFPTPDKQDYVSARAYRRMMAGKIQLTDGVLAVAKKSPNVARDVITSEVKGLMRDLLKMENFFFFRDGSGKVATVMVNYAGGTPTLVEVDDPRGLWEGAQFDLYASGGTLRATQAAVSTIASAPDATDYAQVTLSGNASTAMVATDYLTWKGATSSNTITGLKALIDDTSTTNFQYVSTTSVPRYTSLVMGNSGTARELTPNLFRQMLAGIKQKAGNDAPAKGLTVLASNWDAINVEELYEGDMRLSPSDKVGGLAIQSFQSALGKIDIVTDADMLLGSMFFGDFGQIYRGVQKPLAWRKDGQASIFKRNDEAGVYTATALEIAEYLIKERHTSGRLDDLSYSRSTVY